VDSWVVVPLTVAALGVCWLLAWVALLLVFMWLVRRGADTTTLRVFVRLAETWRMPTGPMHMIELAAARRRAEKQAELRRSRFSRRRGRMPPGSP
jgi:hypothetical protein